MKTLYITKDTLGISLNGENLIVSNRDEGKEPAVVRLQEVEGVVVIGQPRITFQSLYKLIDMDIPCSFITSYGKWRGQLVPLRDCNSQRRLAQYGAASDRRRNIFLARKIVRSKICNSRRMLQHFSSNRKTPLSRQMAAPSRVMGNYLEKLEHVEEVGAIRALEGNAANLYYSSFGLFCPEDFRFMARSKNPPLDEINAMMSFAYSVMASEIGARIHVHGLDQAIGHIHSNKSNAPSLVFDLMESFRSPLCDRLVLRLANRGTIGKSHFRRIGEKAVYMTEEGTKIFLREYEDVVNTRFEDQNGESTTYRREFDRQICSYIRMLEGDSEAELFKVS